MFALVENRGGYPTLGNNISIGWDVSIIGAVTIADGCKIGAGAVVTHSCDRPDSVLCGVPAKVLENKDS